MIRKLCGHVDPRRLYVTIARTIEQETDLTFAQELVRLFGWILLTAVETEPLREELLLAQPSVSTSAANGLPSNAAAVAEQLFLDLLGPWFHNPVSALALCLWSHQYELAAELTARFAAFEPPLDLISQLDQLVHLLESPSFSRLRLRLLEPRKNPALLRCLLGLAMLLPQAAAFNILLERIYIVQSGLLLEAQNVESTPEPAAPQIAMLGASTRQIGEGLSRCFSLQLGGESDNPPAGQQQADSRMLWWPDSANASRDVVGLLGRFDAVAASAAATQRA